MFTPFWNRAALRMTTGLFTALIDRALAKESTPVKDEDIPKTAIAVTKEIYKSPEVRKAIDAVPWWQSAHGRQQAIAVLTPIAAAIGYTLSPEHQEAISAAILLGGYAIHFVVAWIARRRALRLVNGPNG